MAIKKRRAAKKRRSTKAKSKATKRGIKSLAKLRGPAKAQKRKPARGGGRPPIRRP
jgi:hypothetical protein